MRRRLVSLAVVLVAVMALAAPAFAGGWASVRLDGPPPPAFQEIPWTVGFMVKQHDVSPINLDEVFLEATHRETGEFVRADAVQEGDVGHYSVTATFPLAGEWKWSITPGGFAGSSFPTLNVLAGPSEGASASAAATQTVSGPHPAHIHGGSCATLGDVVYPLNNVGGEITVDGTPVAEPKVLGAESAVTVAVSVTVLDTMLFSIRSGEFAINVHESEENIGNYIACGDVGGAMIGDDLIVGLRPLNNSGMAGVAVLHGDGTKTVVTVYLFAVGSSDAGSGTPEASASTAGGETATIALTGSGENWVFAPAHLEIKAGTTVTWTNETEVAHTVSGSKLDFEDSGYLDPGQSFSQTFDTPGTYFYDCDPHPWMTATIVVT